MAIKATAILTGEISADLIKTGTLNADLIKTGTLSADLIKGGTLDSSVINGATLKIEAGASIVGWQVDNNSICKRTADGSWGKGTFMCTGSNSSYSIGGSDKISGWVFGAGGKFGVRSNGAVWCSDLHATGGDIGGWRISERGISNGKHQSESSITESSRVITLENNTLTQTDYMANLGIMGTAWAKWWWIIECARDWAAENGFDMSDPNDPW